MHLVCFISLLLNDSPKAEKCRMLGYSETSKNGYIIWVIRTRTVTVRTNVIFDEHPPDDPDFYPNLSVTEKSSI